MHVLRQSARLACLLATLSGTSSLAQPPPAPSDIVALEPNLHVIDEDASHGGAITIFSGTDGTVIIDTGIASLAPAAARYIASLGANPVRFVINTHGHVDETGGNAYFAERGATIIARSQVRASMQAMASSSSSTPPAGDKRDTRQLRPLSPASLPVITVGQDLTLHVNGQDIQMVPLAAAHTDGDALVLFPGLNILVAGDVLRIDEFPSINRASGGTLTGMLAALDRLIDLSDANTRIITSRGTIGRRDDAQVQRRQLVTARDRIADQIKAGHHLDQILASGVTADFGVPDRPGRISHEAFVRDLYNELTR